MHRILNNSDVGMNSARKDFLDKGVTNVTKVSNYHRTIVYYQCGMFMYMSLEQQGLGRDDAYFSPDVQQQLVEGDQLSYTDPATARWRTAGYKLDLTFTVSYI